MAGYTAGGKIRTTTVNGLTLSGLWAADGSINVVIDDVTSVGQYHPCGAIRVNSGTGVSYYDGTGAAYSNHLLGPGK